MSKELTSFINDVLDALALLIGWAVKSVVFIFVQVPMTAMGCVLWVVNMCLLLGWLGVFALGFMVLVVIF